MRTQHTVVINKPTDLVFGIVSNLENMAKYEGLAMSGRKASEGPIGLGTRFEINGRMMFGKMHATVEITEWRPGAGFTITTRTSPVPVETRYEFAPAEGGTRLTVTDDTQLGGIFKLLEPLLSRYTKQRFQTDMNNMKRYLESLP
jgi:hypothetical protein